MSDLEALGRALRQRRKEIRMPGAELARRLGISPTYVWLVEEARPRPNGSPSRPGEDLLERWLQVLGLDAERSDLRALAGYYDLGVARTVDDTLHARAIDPYPAPPAFHSFEEAFPRALMQPPMPSMAPMASAAPPPPPAPKEQDLSQTLEQTLATARDHGREEEAEGLLRSFLLWLQTHVRT